MPVSAVELVAVAAVSTASVDVAVEGETPGSVVTGVNEWPERGHAVQAGQ